jgi:hypothetical protein
MNYKKDLIISLIALAGAIILFLITFSLTNFI